MRFLRASSLAINCKYFVLFTALFITSIFNSFAQKQIEHLDRGLIGIKNNSNHLFLSWRLLVNDNVDVSFDIYRQSLGKSLIKLNKKPISKTTFFIDSTVNFSLTNSWMVKVSAKQTDESGATFKTAANADVKPYFSIPIEAPADGEIEGSKFTYSANDASVADLDGDGSYEIILKWEPSNAKNPPQTGFTGNQIIDAYTLAGKLLWRIDLGKNIRSGAAYTQFLVYDFNGDGKAEMITKTADGTIDGDGKVIGDANKDLRSYDKKSGTYGKIVEGPEYLTVFDGKSGAALSTVDFIPNRYPLDGWGGTGGNGGNDNTGGRPDRFTAGVAYLDGKTPSAFFVRGWYGRTVIAAWDWKNGKLSSKWVFDSKDRKNPYSGMANHSVSIADVDNDGKDEICVGAMIVDDDGKGLFTTGFGHGDALHVAKMNPEHEDVYVFGVHEIEDSLKTPVRPGVALYSAKTGKPYFTLARNIDVGRGVAADIDPTHLGFENWGGPGGLRDLNGKTISEETPNSANFVVWWDGDLTRELLDKNRIDKWDWKNKKTVNLFTAIGATSNNGTKATPALSADLFGDWREEVIWRTPDNKELRIYSTTIPTNYRFTTLMQDPQYRAAIAGENVGYNQPPHPGFYLGEGMRKPTKANVLIVPLK
ncbi:rhamnogalacturonan lyase [Pedobacter frigiditerrae]|uniref:rhamnogalacturonan lyase n=1 Tax=Pedobacter frigiditerrae TaxID=2530452 RepID=UPI00292CA80D|nr:rhamnogalacturonan lyase [Pedobacter frigiditerrae]